MFFIVFVTILLSFKLKINVTMHLHAFACRDNSDKKTSTICHKYLEAIRGLLESSSLEFRIHYFHYSFTGSILAQKSHGILSALHLQFFAFGLGWCTGGRNFNFYTRVVKNRNRLFFAKSNPGQKRFPIPNGVPAADTLIFMP